MPAEEAARRLAAQNAERDFLNGKAGGQPLTTQIARGAGVNQIRPIKGGSPSNLLARPLRSSQSFVERR